MPSETRQNQNHLSCVRHKPPRSTVSATSHKSNPIESWPTPRRLDAQYNASAARVRNLMINLCNKHRLPYQVSRVRARALAFRPVANNAVGAKSDVARTLRKVV